MEIRETYQFNKASFTSIRDPLSALSHFIGFIMSIILMPVLFIKASKDNISMELLIGCAVYSLSMILLYGASSAYHSFILPFQKQQILKKLDHMSIFILIAGTYTPFCLRCLDQQEGLYFLILLWLFALSGMIMKAFYVNCQRYLSSIIYLAMGWLALFRLKAFYAQLGPIGFTLVILGGIFYSAGAIIYALKFRIDENWSEHEIFHIFVLVASLYFYAAIFFFVV